MELEDISINISNNYRDILVIHSNIDNINNDIITLKNIYHRIFIILGIIFIAIIILIIYDILIIYYK